MRISDWSSDVCSSDLEPQGRYELAHVATRAEAGRLTGRKSVVVNGDAADLLIVSARTAGGATDPDGIGLFLVERGAAGLTIRGNPNIDGGRSAARKSTRLNSSH